MNKKRVDRISQEIKKVLSNVLYNGLKDPRIDPLKVGITACDVTNDLSFCTVYISVIGDRETKERTIEGFKKARGFLKKEIAQGVDVRHVPQLIFKLDETQENAMAINRLIEEIHHESEQE